MPISKLKRALKAGAATLVGNVAPWGFFFLASKKARTALHLECRAGWIDIVDRKGRRKIRISRRNSIYLPHIADCFDYYHASAGSIEIASKGIAFDVVDFSTPRYHEIAGFPEFPILCPSFTEPFLTTQQYLDLAELKEGDVALDLGCYSGLTSIAFSRTVGMSGRVVALEPDPANFAAARTNIERHILLSKIDNIVLMNRAAAAGRGMVSFASDGTMGASDAAIVGAYRGEAVVVETLGLEDIADTCQLDRIDFVKIDVEGSELNVLSGAEGFFRRFRPTLIVEPHMCNGVFSEAEVITILQGFQYRCQTIQQAGLNWPLVVAVPQNR